MAFVPDPNNISIDYGTYIIHVPKSVSTLIQATPTEIREMDLNQFRLKLKDLEDDSFGMAELRTHKHNTTVSVGGVDLARVIEIINGYTVTFEDGQYAVQLTGANSNIGDVVNVNQVSIRTSNSVGLVTSKAIEYGEYNGYVTVDKLSDYTSTVYPTGTGRQPVNNIPDAVAICVQYGFPEIHVVGSIELGLGDDVDKLKIVGVSHVNANITVLAEALCLETAFDSFDITGVLDGDSEITNCVVHDIEYFNGHIHNSLLSGTIKLRGSEDANISNCSILDILNPPTIDAGGSGQNLVMPRFSGLLTVTNLTGASHLGIGLDGADITIDSTCISGIIAVSGNGRVVDNSGEGCYVVNTASDGTELANLQTLIETQRPHHTGTGDVYYWDPVNGDDFRDGGHPDRAVKTFAEAHNMAKDNNHDIIFCISGDPSGTTIANENIVFTKNYLFLRGPGRDFTIHSIDDTKPSIDIQSNGVEVSGMIVSTELTNTTSSIKTSGGFPLIKNVFLENSVNAIDIVGGKNGIVDSCRIGHNSGYGIKVSGDSSHFSIKYSHIGSNGNNGIIVDCTTGHELEIEYSTIHENTGYGIDVVNGDDIMIKADVSIFNNTIGDYNGTGIVDLRLDLDNVVATISPTDITNITDSVLSTDLTPYVGGSGLGGVLGDVDGKIDIVDSNVDLLLTNITLLDGKVDVIGANIDTVLANQDIINAEIANIPLEVWNFDSNHNFIDNSMGEELSHIKYINHFVFIDATVPVNGDGSQHNPFDNITDAIDLAEANNTKQLIVFSDINVDRQLKNFTIIGVGSPRVDFLSLPDLTGSTFKDCILLGQHLSNITAKFCRLENGLSLNGRYINCGLNGDLVCTGTSVVFVDGASVIAGQSRPTISMNPTGYCSLSMRSQRGGLTVKDCNNALDVVTVGISEGSLTFDSSCSDGEMVARGSCVFVDETTGANVSDETFSPYDTRNIALQVWNFSKDTVFIANSMGEWVVKKLLSIKVYLGLK